MYFNDVVGLEGLKQKLVANVMNNRISHAQLFLGPTGSGTLALALAYARYIHCTDRGQNDACGTCHACKKMDSLTHPDIHFFFPTAKGKTAENESDKPLGSKMFYKQWREMLAETRYPSFANWLDKLGVQNQQAIIYSADCNEIIKEIFMKPFESNYKVVVIWMVEKLKAKEASRLLKTLEEPPDQTVFLLVSQNKEEIIKTILSRTQLISIPFLRDSEIEENLVKKYGLSSQEANDIAFLAGGSFSEALNLLDKKNEPGDDFEAFRSWMRLCYNKNKEMKGLLDWIENTSKQGRERQKAMLQGGLVVFRQCLLHNYNAQMALRLEGKHLEFVQNFSRFTNHANILEIEKKFNDAIFHVERNANPKILFTELSLSMASLLRKTP